MWSGWLGKLMWAAGALSLLFAWWAIYKAGAMQAAQAAGEALPYESATVFGIEALAWYWNALVLGVLASMPSKWGCRGRSCMACMPEEKSGEAM